MGGYVYRGSVLSTFVGTYFYAEHATGEIFALFFDEQGAPLPADDSVVLDLNTRIASFSEDADGELYVLDHQTGSVQRLVPAGPPVADTFPALLSETGCADPANPAEPSSGLVPYGTAHSLYSDGAFKERYVGIPDGAQATILADGDIDFPVGTVFRKDFVVAGERVETRLLMGMTTATGAATPSSGTTRAATPRSCRPPARQRRSKTGRCGRTRRGTAASPVTRARRGACSGPSSHSSTSASSTSRPARSRTSSPRGTPSACSTGRCPRPSRSCLRSRPSTTPTRPSRRRRAHTCT
jgi:hypothetical protein